MVLVLRTREPVVKPLASLSPGQDPQRPISAQTNWCRVRDFHPQPLRSERCITAMLATLVSVRKERDTNAE